MPSFITTIACMALAGGAGASARGALLHAPTPVITPGPQLAPVEAFMKRDDPDAVSLARVLLTAIPESLREIAATNVPAVSSILREEFLDEKRPEWFLELPSDVQSYLIHRFGPSTAWASVTESATNSAPTSQASPTASVGTTQTQASESGVSRESTKLVTSVVTVSTGSVGIPIAAPTPSSSSTSSSETTNTSSPGLSKQQKIGIGVGIPFAILGAAAFSISCCFLLRRHRRRSVNGSIPPSSPGFIPRFAFQEKSTENLDHHIPLNRDASHSSQDLDPLDWDGDDIDLMENTQMSNVNYHQQPIMAPALYHTHSSNRARGKRTSYSSLHSVAEVSEPDEAESPVLPRQSPPRQSPPRRRSLIPPPIPVAAQVKRKPVPIPSSSGDSPAAQAASQTLLRQTMPSHASRPTMPYNSSSSSSGLSGFRNHTRVAASPDSFLEEQTPKNPNPFSNDYSYVEDYGPEYHPGHIDLENGLYGGHTSLSRYPEPPKSSKTEWPLRNATSYRRNKSPLWDRIYEG